MDALHEIILDEYGHPLNNRYLDANPDLEKISGRKAADIIGKTVLEFCLTLKYSGQRYTKG